MPDDSFAAASPVVHPGAADQEPITLPTHLQQPAVAAMDDGEAAEEDVWLTPAEVARILMVDPQTVSRWARQGRLPNVRTLTGRVRVPRSDLQAFLDAFDAADDHPWTRWRNHARSVPAEAPAPRLRPRTGPLATRPRPPGAGSLSQLRWADDAAGMVSVCSGPGWHAEVRAVPGGFQATLSLAAETLTWPVDPAATPRTMLSCKRWARRELEAQLRRPGRRRRGGSEADPP